MRRRESSRARALLGVLTAHAVVTSALAARADPARSDDLFHEGKALLEQGHVPEACDKFAESLAIARRGGTLLNLAVCREAEGLYAAALRLFEAAREVAGRDGRADRVALADEHIAIVRSRLSWLVVRPPQHARGDLTITCDGGELSRDAWGSPTAVDPGSHTVTAAAPGQAALRITVVVGPAGDTRTVDVPPLAARTWETPSAPLQANGSPPAETRAPPRTEDRTPSPGRRASTPADPVTLAPPSSRREDSWKRVVGSAAIGAGTVATLVGGAFAVAAIVDSNASRGLCPGDVCHGDGFQKNQEARSAAIGANVFLASGLVAAGVGVYLRLTSRAPSTPIQATQATSNRARPAGAWVVSDVVGAFEPGAAAFALRGSW